MKQTLLTVVHAAAVLDAAGTAASPGAVLVKEGRVVASGDPASLPAELVQRARVIDRRKHLLLPAMVNAHTHLELTAIGPQPYDQAGGFVGWVMMLRSHWPENPEPGILPDDRWFVSAAKRGAAMSLAQGVQAVGDICRFATVAQSRRGAGLTGVNYLEMFGLGPPFDESGRRLIADAQSGADGLQPHAPYSAGPALFDGAARSGLPVCTHLAETLDEAAFVSQLTGPKFEFVRERGIWDDRFAEHYGRGLSPVKWMERYLAESAAVGGWLVAHCNYVSDDDIRILADTNTSVAYCPIASEYFGHQGHRYRDMLAAGVNVCLGTDSVVCADPADPQPLGLLGAMRRLHQRDQADPVTLLAMATLHGARALRLAPATATLQPGAPARFVCIEIDPAPFGHPSELLAQALNRRNIAEAVSLG